MSVSIERHARVIGPPGTGKTHTLLRLSQAAVQRYGPERVVVASYTRKAAAEIRARGGEHVPSHVGTVHSLAIRALSAQGAQVEILQDHRGIALFLEGSPQWAEDIEALQSELDCARSTGKPASTWNARLRAYSRDWMLYLQDEGGTDFYGLLERATREEAIPHESPAVVLHDEAQDATGAERRYLDVMVRAGAVLIEFGDPLQTLYQFRGACPRAFAERQGVAEHLLAQSYRVPRRVLEFARRWMDSHGVSLPPYMPRDDDGLVRLQRGSPSGQDSGFCDRVIETADATGSMMVLAPTRRGLQGLLHDLQDRGYPYGSAAHTGRPWSPLRDPMACHVADLIAPALEGRPGWTWAELASWTSLSPKALRSPEYERSKSWPSEPLGAPSQHALRGVLSAEAYRAFGQVSSGGKKTALTVPRTAGADPLRTCRTIFTSCGGHVAREGRERALPLWLTCSEIIQARHYKARLGEYLVRVAEQHGLEFLRGKTPALQVSTLHAAKGGEADVVWLSDCFGERFARGRSTVSGLESTRNMIYVGITRARHELALLDQGRHSAGLARYVPT